MKTFSNITKTHDGSDNFWDINPHMIYVKPFSEIYSLDKKKDKEKSSKDMWCVFWLTDPDEEVNKYYRIPTIEERLDICKSYNPDFDEEHPLIKEAIEKYPHLCLNADELAYKLQKDQLIEISQFLAEQTISMENIKEIIELKAKMPKIYQDFEKIDKMFRTGKDQQRIHGGRKKTPRERGMINPNN